MFFSPRRRAFLARRAARRRPGGSWGLAAHREPRRADGPPAAAHSLAVGAAHGGRSRRGRRRRGGGAGRSGADAARPARRQRRDAPAGDRPRVGDGRDARAPCRRARSRRLRHRLLGPSGCDVRRRRAVRRDRGTYLSAKWPHLERDGTVLLRASVGRFGDDRAMALDDDALVARVREELGVLCALRAEPQASVVHPVGGRLPPVPRPPPPARDGHRVGRCRAPRARRGRRHLPRASGSRRAWAAGGRPGVACSNSWAARPPKGAPHRRGRTRARRGWRRRGLMGHPGGTPASGRGGGPRARCRGAVRVLPPAVGVVAARLCRRRPPLLAPGRPSGPDAAVCGWLAGLACFARAVVGRVLQLVRRGRPHRRRGALLRGRRRSPPRRCTGASSPSPGPSPWPRRCGHLALRGPAHRRRLPRPGRRPAPRRGPPGRAPRADGRSSCWAGPHSVSCCDGRVGRRPPRPLRRRARHGGAGRGRRPPASSVRGRRRRRLVAPTAGPAVAHGSGSPRSKAGGGAGPQVPGATRPPCSRRSWRPPTPWCRCGPSVALDSCCGPRTWSPSAARWPAPPRRRVPVRPGPPAAHHPGGRGHRDRRRPRPSATRWWPGARTARSSAPSRRSTGCPSASTSPTGGSSPTWPPVGRSPSTPSPGHGTGLLATPAGAARGCWSPTRSSTPTAAGRRCGPAPSC